MAFSENIIPVITVAGTVIAALFSVLFVVSRFYRKVEQGQALIINKLKSEPDVTTTGGIVLPVIHKMEVIDISTKRMLLERKGKGGLICKDNIRADIAITFYIRVNENKEDILRVAKQVGCARASEPETLQDLFEAKFSEALKTVGKQLNFVELFTQRNEFRDKIKEVIGEDLSGYSLEDVAIDYLEQTPINQLDPMNILDAEGIRRITELTTKQNIETNQLKENENNQIKQQNTVALEKNLELERQAEEARARQAREVSNIRAREKAESERIEQEERLKSEQARITTEEAIAIAEQNKQRELDIAEQNRLRVLAIEQEKVLRAQEIERIERERETEVLRINKEKSLEVERRNIAEVVRERVAVEKTVAEEQERIKDMQTIAEAERQKQALVIRAKADAEQALVKDIESAKAAEQAAAFKAREKELLAAAELRIANQSAEAKKILADATRTEITAKGQAEADIIKAKAEANQQQGEVEALVLERKLHAEAEGKKQIGLVEAEVQKQQLTAQAEGKKQVGLAEAEVQLAMAQAAEKQGETDAANLEKRMLAEAKGLEEKLKALNAMNKEARDYESFTLQLEQQRTIALASLEAQQNMAEHQAEVLAKAFGNADINIMGGDGQFFEQFAKALTLGKSIDGAVGQSDVLQNLLKGHLNGERNLLEDLKGVLGGNGAETLKNINMSKLLNQLSQQVEQGQAPQLQQLLGQLARQPHSDSNA